METYMTVPSAIGLTSASANSVITNAGFNFAIDGTQEYDIGDSAVVVPNIRQQERRFTARSLP